MAEIPVIPKAGEIYVHTGNIVNWNRLKKNLTQSPENEVTSETPMLTIWKTFE